MIDRSKVLPFRVIEGGAGRGRKMPVSHADDNTASRKMRRDLVTAVETVAAKWLALPKERRERVVETIREETEAARKAGETSLLYLDSGGHWRSLEDPYIAINLMTRYAEMEPDLKCVAGATIIEEHRNSVTGSVSTYWSEEWTDALLINQKGPPSPRANR